MERHGHLALDAVVRTRLETVSPATIDQNPGTGACPRRRRAPPKGELAGDPAERADPGKRYADRPVRQAARNPGPGPLVGWKS